MLVTLDDIVGAAERISGRVIRTPLLSTVDCPLWIKPECLQPTGAFKLRGATNAVLRLGSAGRGVVTHSSGNHSQALAYVARRAGLPATVVMPDNSQPAKIEATRALGATVHLVPPTEREKAAWELAEAHGLMMVGSYDDPNVIAGQGTVGLEIVQDAPDVDVVLVPVGGGGLAAGVGTAIKALRPQAAVIGVEPELAADAAESLRLGTRTAWDPALTARTIADGVRHPVLGELAWAHINEYLDGILTVTEDEIAAAVRFLATRYRVVAEPSGALSTAAYLRYSRHGWPDGPDGPGWPGRHRGPGNNVQPRPGGRAVAVVSGGNGLLCWA